MTLARKTNYDLMNCTTSAELEAECVSLEESRRRVKELVHKHFQK